MKRTQLIMGMPITIEIPNEDSIVPFNKLFNYFKRVDSKYSTYKSDSEISRINKGLDKNKWSSEMKEVLELCEETKRLSGGYFDVVKDGFIDPSGLVKGWSINNAALQLKDLGYNDFYIEAGGDIQLAGKDETGSLWSVGIRNPFDIDKIVKVLHLTDCGIATSGTYIRGEHIYNPLADYSRPTGIRSLTVIGPDIYEADRFATAAFAMGRAGINFIRSLSGFEAYMIDDDQIATYTEGVESYVLQTV